MKDLALSALRAANVERLPAFEGHTKPDVSDWTLLEWAGCMAGEAGEAIGVAKDMRRGRDLDYYRQQLADEIADVVIYADILAFRAGINLAEAVVAKFNEKSVAVRSDVFLRLTTPP